MMARLCSTRSTRWRRRRGRRASARGCASTTPSARRTRARRRSAPSRSAGHCRRARWRAALGCCCCRRPSRSPSRRSARAARRWSGRRRGTTSRLGSRSLPQSRASSARGACSATRASRRRSRGWSRCSCGCCRAAPPSAAACRARRTATPRACPPYSRPWSAASTGRAGGSTGRARAYSSPGGRRWCSCSSRAPSASSCTRRAGPWGGSCCARAERRWRPGRSPLSWRETGEVESPRPAHASCSSGSFSLSTITASGGHPTHASVSVHKMSTRGECFLLGSLLYVQQQHMSTAKS
mmetsp:Transcript_16421/g.53162  ORF Transcript_16421/g.53162 Transcript_16421/m.53162 type:complete len:296 (-) Transcript_16421:8-895(-)